MCEQHSKGGLASIQVDRVKRTIHKEWYGKPSEDMKLEDAYDRLSTVYKHLYHLEETPEWLKLVIGNFIAFSIL